jgi:transposase, IS5 family
LLRFCGLQWKDEVPDPSVVCRFRKALPASGAWEVGWQPINTQRSRHGVWVKHGAIIEASVTPTLRKPQGKTHDTLAPQGPACRQHSLQPGVDKEAKWVKKGSQLQYGYKYHDLTAEDTGLVLAGHPTAARVHDGQGMASCLDRVALPSGSRLLADKGYCSAKTD